MLSISTGAAVSADKIEAAEKTPGINTTNMPASLLKVTKSLILHPRLQQLPGNEQPVLVQKGVDEDQRGGRIDSE
jgi:hypothetical protein